MACVFSTDTYKTFEGGGNVQAMLISIEGFIFTLYFIYLIIILFFIKFVCNYINENLEESLPLPRALKSNRVDVHWWLTVVRCLFLR